MFAALPAILQIITLVMFIIFVIHAWIIIYHWYAYGTKTSDAHIIAVAYPAIGLIMLAVMAISTFNL